MIKMLWMGLLELVYPSNIYCISCGSPIDQRFPYSLCPFCVRHLRWADKITCGKCGKPMWNRTATGLCSECVDAQRSFDRGYTCVSYGLAERALIHQLKYKDKDYLAAYMAELMAERIAIEELNPDLVVPVPMHKDKQKRRGYNQAALLAKFIGEHLDIPCSPKLLIRRSDTLPMSGLGAVLRKKNVEGVFFAAKWVENTIYGKTVLLVDDVFTTGSTAEACSTALKEAGARCVYVLTFAAGTDNKSDNGIVRVCG